VTGRTISRSDRGMLAAALASVGSFLIEPAEPVERSGWAPDPVEQLRARPVVAVFGLARGCGTTTVARALAVELASRDPANAAIVACESPAAGVRLATQPAARLARSIQDYPRAHARAVGRLCLVHADLVQLTEGARHLAPLVLDAGSSGVGGVPASLADRTVLVTTPAAEPALARVAADCLARVGPEPVIVLNRVTDARPVAHQDGALPGPGSESNGQVAGGHAHRDAGRSPIPLPDSRLGAQLALSGREPRGALGHAVVRLADRGHA
jgi:hypothetical protein